MKKKKTKPKLDEVAKSHGEMFFFLHGLHSNVSLLQFRVLEPFHRTRFPNPSFESLGAN